MTASPVDEGETTPSPFAGRVGLGISPPAGNVRLRVFFVRSKGRDGGHQNSCPLPHTRRLQNQIPRVGYHQHATLDDFGSSLN